MNTKTRRNCPLKMFMRPFTDEKVVPIQTYSCVGGNCAWFIEVDKDEHGYDGDCAIVTTGAFAQHMLEKIEEADAAPTCPSKSCRGITMGRISNRREEEETGQMHWRCSICNRTTIKNKISYFLRA